MAPCLTHSRGSIKALALGGRSRASPEGRFHCTNGLLWENYLETDLLPSLPPSITPGESSYDQRHDLGQVTSFPRGGLFPRL